MSGRWSYAGLPLTPDGMTYRVNPAPSELPARLTQNQKVLAALKACGEDGLSARAAFIHLGIYRLGARIYDLRLQGCDIEMRRKHGECATYTLVRGE